MAKTKHPNLREPSTRQAEADSYLEFLDSLDDDLDEVSSVGRSQKERKMLAERLLEEAQDSDSPLEMVPPLLRAIRVDPACLDARLLLLSITGGPADEKIEELQRIVATGEAELGSDFFTENHGYFWGILETRPYMRARAMLAQLLRGTGRLEEAIAHHEAMLELCEGDNLGMRYPLVSAYLESGRREDAARLIARFNEESTMLLWAHVLERYLAGELTEAETVLAGARKENRYIEEFLTGRRRLPKEPPPYYSPGSVDEAVISLPIIGNAWEKYPEAIAWLMRVITASPLKKKSPAKKMIKPPTVH